MNKLSFIAILLVLSVVLFFPCGCGKKHKKPNIILIVPDALRAKQLTVYGYEGNKTPVIDALAKRSVRFDLAVVKQAGTITSFSCFFSGLLFPSGGLKRGEKTLAEYLTENGYTTAAVVSSRMLWTPEHKAKGGKDCQFNRGFAHYMQDTTLTKPPYHRKNQYTTRDVIQWLENNKSNPQPYFLSVHYMDPHAPYKPDYNGEIRKIDVQVGRILKKLRKLRQFKNSIIIFTSDHGESLGNPVEDHGSPRGHGWFTYLEQIRIPLFIKFPGSKYTRTVKQLVRNYDLMPTILDYLGISYNRKKLAGVSLMPAVQEGRDLELMSYHEGVASRVRPEGSVAVIQRYKGDYFHFIKGMYAGTYRELYNITRDPKENNNLIDLHEYSPLVKKMNYSAIKYAGQKDASQWRIKCKSQPHSLNKSARSALESLGYLVGGAPAPDKTAGTFAMEQQLPGIATLKYSGLIRTNTWGLVLGRDDHFPIKIVTAPKKTGRTGYIIQNIDGSLLVYDTPDFKALDRKGVTDIAMDSRKQLLFFLEKGNIITMDMVVSKFKAFNAPPSAQPIRAIYLDKKGYLFLVKAKHLVKLNREGAVTARLDIDVESSSLLAVDTSGRIFTAVGNIVKTYSPEGNFTGDAFALPPKAVIVAIELDGKGNLWCVERDQMVVHVLPAGSKKPLAFMYNFYQINPKQRKNLPIPVKDLHIGGDTLYITDNWEGILTYTIHYE